MRSEETKESSETVVLTGEVSRVPTWGPIRILLIVSGLILIRDLLSLLARYCLGLRGRASASVRGETIAVTVEWSIFGRRFRRSRTESPVQRLTAVRFENRQRYLHLLVGFGALTVGTLVGMQWFLDGLRAGYPYLVLVGAAIVAAGVVVDMAVYVFVPKGVGRSHLVLALGPWIIRLVGGDPTQAEAFWGAVHAGWKR